MIKKNKQAISLILMAILLTSCNNSLQDLEQYVQKVRKETIVKIEPIIKIPLEKEFIYRESHKKPFGESKKIKKIILVEPIKAKIIKEKPKPKPKLKKETTKLVIPTISKIPLALKNRKREFLERFSLKEIKFIGTIQNGNKQSGLIQTPDGVIHKIKLGNYLGKNHGKIILISEKNIMLENQWNKQKILLLIKK